MWIIVCIFSIWIFVWFVKREVIKIWKKKNLGEKRVWDNGFKFGFKKFFF